MAISLADNALTTLATLKEDLGISGSSDDEQLKRIINAASDRVETYCQRSFYRVTTETDRVPGYGWTKIYLARTPVNSITSVTYDGDTVDSDNYTLRDARSGLVEKSGGWNWSAHQVNNITSDPLPGTERYLYLFTYDGGWYTPKQYDDDNDNTRALPWDIEDACLEICRMLWFAKKRDPSITAEKLMDWNASYGSNAATVDAASGLPTSAIVTLKRYKRIITPGIIGI